MSAPVDVLAVMDYAVETYKRLHRESVSPDDHLLDIEDAEAARGATAEAFEALRGFVAFAEERKEELGELSREMEACLANGRHALAHVGGVA